jgi:hypothetical protein
MIRPQADYGGLKWIDKKREVFSNEQSKLSRSVEVDSQFCYQKICQRVDQWKKRTNLLLFFKRIFEFLKWECVVNEISGSINYLKIQRDLDLQPLFQDQKKFWSYLKSIGVLFDMKEFTKTVNLLKNINFLQTTEN